MDPIKKIIVRYRISKIIISKLTERAAVNQLCLHSDCRFTLLPYQSAYRVGHSTETVLVKVQYDILQNMDQQKVSQLVLIDL